MAYKDPLDERARAARRKHYEANKEQYLRRNAEAKKKKQEYIREARNVPCMDCGGIYPYYVMDFDHRDPSQKMGNISRMLGHSWTKLKAEIAKCDIVCANCHRHRTYLQYTDQSAG
jgi:hypothetical protein